ncbi:MAG: succinate dehydrogenase, cytochrome b556 subunit [Thiogranum sp.]|nr:succinate dehydrogenase, cytochrome b556 subunit [Thiogranum sp.]
MVTQKPAPKFLNLLRIKLPPGAVASIGHRISGMLMFLSIPLVVWQFALSLESPEGLAAARHYLRSIPALVISVILVWSFNHHLLAGIRHLLLDIHIGMDKYAARRSARVVNAGALVLTLVYLVWIL